MTAAWRTLVDESGPESSIQFPASCQNTQKPYQHVKWFGGEAAFALQLCTAGRRTCLLLDWMGSPGMLSTGPTQAPIMSFGCFVCGHRHRVTISHFLAAV
jgi:hypothetical protein